MEQKPTQEHAPHKQQEESVSYLGVELEKGAGGLLTPNKERFTDDVITNFDLELMRKIATGLKLSQPVLLEGGSGIGKTRTIDRMCAELHREFYIANCHKMQIEDLVGSMSTDENTTSGFGWKDGVITQAVRNGGVLFLDEYNFMPGETRGGIHQIFDALLQGKTHITLPEHNNEQVAVHPNFRIIAAQNPPGGAYGDREVLDPAQIDRFMTIKLPEELPQEIRKSRLLGSIGIDNDITLTEDDYTFSSEGISREALGDIPGIEELLEKYLEVTKQLQEAQERGEIASREYQPVSFGTSRDDQRIMQYITSFYDGDINKVMGDALTLYYENKLSNPDERATVRTLLERVRYEPPVSSKRRGLEKEPTTGSQESTESTESTREQTILKDLNKILGAEGPSNNLARALTGLGSPESMTMRQDLIDQGVDKAYIARGLAGVSTPESMTMRQEFIDQGVDKDFIAQGLAGVSTPESMTMRQEFIDQGVDKDFIAQGLAGVSTPESMTMRQEFIDQGVNKNNIARGLAGVSTPESMTMRQDLIDQGVNKNDIARGLAGVSTPESMTMRQEFIDQGVDKNDIATGLAGVSTPESMTMRQEFIDQGVNKAYIALGLAGVSTPESMTMRQEFIDQGVDKDFIARGLAGVSTPESMTMRDQLEQAGASRSQTYTTNYFARDLVAHTAAQQFELQRSTEIFDKAYIKEALTQIQDLIDQGVDKAYIALGLAGVSTPESMTMRQDLIDQGVDKAYIALGLAGVSTPESMTMRQEFIDQGVNKNDIARGLAGVSTPESMTMRQEFIDLGVNKAYIARGLAGVSTPESMTMRQEFIDQGVDKDFIAQGLAGVSTPESMTMRQEFIDQGVNKAYIAQGLAGVSTPESMTMRQEFIDQGVDKNDIATGLAGVSTPESMTMRQEFIDQGVNKNFIARGLAGVSTPESMTMRQEFIDQGVDKNDIAEGLAGVSTPESMTTRQDLIDQGAGKDSVASSYFCYGGDSIYMTRIFEQSVKPG